MTKRRCCRWVCTILLLTLLACAALWSNGSLLRTSSAWGGRLSEVVGDSAGGGFTDVISFPKRVGDLLWNQAGGKELREFQGSLEEVRRHYLHFVNSGVGMPPPVTRANCKKIILEAAKAELMEDKNQSASTNRSTRLPQSEKDSRFAIGRQSVKIEDRLKSTANCTRYVFDFGFRFAQVSEEELSFPLAFSMLVYKDLNQVERLLRAVYRPHNVYCIHVDKKSHSLFMVGLRLIVNCLSNVFILEHSIDVQWGKMSVLQPDLDCMERLLSHSTKWRYFINLTGQEFPLRTNKELVQILKALRGANDIGGVRNADHVFRWWQKMKKVAPPYNLTVTKGDVRGLMSRGFVEYAIRSRVGRELIKWLDGTKIPDESFFSTLNYNPHLGAPGSYSGSVEGVERLPMRSYVVWDYETNRTCSGKYVRWVCQLSPGDLHRLVTTSNLIANKFAYTYEPLGYDCLEKWYFGKVRMENFGQAAPLNLSEIENSDTVKLRYTGPVLIWE